MRALASAALLAAFATSSIVAPAPAAAITRDTVMKRANTWVKKKVPYSQRGYYKGYRRDCSGFVSMTWKLGKSYTTRTIHKRAKRIKIKNLKPGDAVLVTGRHVSIFGGWKSKSKRTYYAYEQTTWGSHAKKRVRKIPANAKALRYKKITVPKKKPAVSTPTTGTIPPIGSVDPTGSVPATDTITTTPTVSPELIGMLDAGVSTNNLLI